MAKNNIEKKFVNWDYIIYKWLAKSMENQSGISFEIPRSNFHILNVMNQKILITHGTGIKSWGGIPFYGLARTESKFRSLIDGTKNFFE